ncbi:DUF1905 domain-containing protein [Candidatus Gottesmanbacteria bacterium]|nr:DUF1905 domain-containing protein [Candidatus Gottesmanbacteria bacterium]
MKSTKYKVSAKVWLYQDDSPWHFITIEKEDAEEIKKEYIWPRRGFGAIPVNVKVGNTSWKTSIFPEKKGTYLLPLKKEVRAKENIKIGDTIKVYIEVII